MKEKYIKFIEEHMVETLTKEDIKEFKKMSKNELANALMRIYAMENQIIKQEELEIKQLEKIIKDKTNYTEIKRKKYEKFLKNYDGFIVETEDIKEILKFDEIKIKEFLISLKFLAYKSRSIAQNRIRELENIFNMTHSGFKKTQKAF